jgi:hypothetical protein
VGKVKVCAWNMGIKSKATVWGDGYMMQNFDLVIITYYNNTPTLTWFYFVQIHLLGVICGPEILNGKLER